MKYAGGGIAYILLGGFMIAPMAVESLFISNWQLYMKSDGFYSTYSLLCLILTYIPGLVFFKNNYLNKLKDFGYFAKKK